jgi:hypothetical protein
LSNNDGTTFDLKGDNAINLLAPSFGDFAAKCVRRDLQDMFGITAPDAELSTVWSQVCECLNLVDSNNPPNAPGGVSGYHKSWISFPCATNGVGQAWFDIQPNDNGKRILFPDDLDLHWVIGTDIHPRFRPAVLQELERRFPGAVKSLHYVNWRVWRSELSESLDEFVERDSLRTVTSK